MLPPLLLKYFVDSVELKLGKNLIYMNLVSVAICREFHQGNNLSEADLPEHIMRAMKMLIEGNPIPAVDLVHYTSKE